MRRVCLLLMLSIFAAILATSAFAVDSTPVTTVVEGTITAVTATTTNVGKIVVSVPPITPTGVTKLVTILVNEKTQIYKDGVLAKLSGLAVGDTVRALVVATADGGLLAQMIYAKTPPPPVLKWATGVVSDKALWNGIRTFKLRVSSTTATMWFSVDEKTKITVDGVVTSYDKIANGQTAEVGFVQPPPQVTAVILPILASVVSAKNPPPPPVVHFIGRIVAVDLVKSTISVGNPAVSAAPVVIKITDGTVIDKFGVGAKLAQLVPASSEFAGDSVDVVAKPVVTTEVGALPIAVSVVVAPETMSGVISSVDLVARSFKLIPRTTTTPVVGTVDPSLGVVFYVVPATKIFRNGYGAGLDGLRALDTANLKYFQFPGQKRASLVEAKSPTIGTK